jgi:hypothetical protein
MKDLEEEKSGKFRFSVFDFFRDQLSTIKRKKPDSKSKVSTFNKFLKMHDQLTMTKGKKKGEFEKSFLDDVSSIL